MCVAVSHMTAMWLYFLLLLKLLNLLVVPVERWSLKFCTDARNMILYSFSTYWLTSWSKVLHKLIVAHLVQEFPALYVIRTLITVFKRARHWTISETWIKSVTFHRISQRSVCIISPFTPSSCKWSLRFRYFDHLRHQRNDLKSQRQKLSREHT